MLNKINFLGCIFLLCTSHRLQAQATDSSAVKNPPIAAEALLGTRGMAFQIITNKKFQTLPRLGFFSVTNLVGQWDQRQVNDYMTQGNLTYRIIKGLDVVSGFHATNVTGFRPTAGLMYTYANPEFLMVLSPRADLMKNGTVEGLLLIEYKPPISNTLQMYTRIQALYGQSTGAGLHERSYIMARAGITYHEFTLGLGTNLDWYGPTKHYEENFGGFILLQLL